MQPQSKLIIISGAGLSAESGIATFRDPGAMWEKFNPLELANLESFPEHKEAVFSFYNLRRKELSLVQPNAAHIALATAQKLLGEDRVILFTQNGDDLLTKAGATNVHHIHGLLTDMQCLSCKHVWNIGYTEVASTVPCPNCTKANCKPGVVFFNEEAPLYALLDKTIKEARAPDIILVVGTKGVVLPFPRLVGNRHHPRRPKTYLCNLHKEENIAYNKFFDRCFFGPASTTIPNLINSILPALSTPPVEHKNS